MPRTAARTDKQCTEESTRATNILTLPSEILLQIGRSLSSLGGRSIANFHFTCRRLRTAVEPVFWSSLLIPTDVQEREAFLAHLTREKKSHSLVSSVYYPLTDDLRLVGIAVAVLGTFPALRLYEKKGWAAVERLEARDVVIRL